MPWEERLTGIYDSWPRSVHAIDVSPGDIVMCKVSNAWYDRKIDAWHNSSEGETLIVISINNLDIPKLYTLLRLNGGGLLKTMNLTSRLFEKLM